ncbi:Gldg family protein, partial [Porcipelethomonas sp.]|uniref:Gldg family protein n=1 Tax=Porcipelethomonas sp. TaxID=2981675 RepID=UPI003EF265AF
MDPKKSKKNIKFTTIAWALAAMLLVIIILINIAASTIDIKFDMTPNKLYSLSQTTTDYLDSLDDEVDIYLLMEMDEIRKDDSMLAFTSMMDQYSEYDKINLIDIDPDTNPDIVKELNPDGYLNLKEGDMLVKCGDLVKRIPASSMYLYEGEYDDNGEFNVENAYFQGENYITGAIKAVVEGVIPSVYFLTGHGEKTLENDYTKFQKNLKNYNYEAKELNLTTEEAVPDDAAIIIVPAPKTDITDAEKEKLDAYMDKGGNLSLLMSPNGDETTYDNILELMHEYGLGMDYNRVYETDSSKHVSGDKYQMMVNLVDITELDDTVKDGLTDLTSALIEDDSLIPYMPESRSFFQYMGENSSELNICPLIETNETAYGEAYGGNEVDPSDISGVLYLAAYSENP